MKTIKPYFYCLVIASWMASCTAAVSMADEAPADFKETPSLKRIVAKDMEWRVQYLPTAFHVMRAERSNPGMTNEQRDSIADEYYPFYYFRANVSGTPRQTKEDVFKYMSYEMQRDFYLVVGNDSIPALFSQAIATGDSKNHEFMLAFPRMDTVASLPLKIVYDDHVFGSGRTQCVFNSNDLKD